MNANNKQTPHTAMQSLEILIPNVQDNLIRELLVKAYGQLDHYFYGEAYDALDNHDCHMKPEDGCTCSEFDKIKYMNALHDELGDVKNEDFINRQYQIAESLGA